MSKRRVRAALIISLLAIAVLAIGESEHGTADAAAGTGNMTGVEDRGHILSPIWSPSIRQWSAQIEQEAYSSGLDPDFIAAVMHAESNGVETAVSRVGAVGLMGVMPTGPGLEWRSSTEILIDADINLSWGVAILTSIIQQSGGDLVAALAAYSGGWDQASSRVPLEYARRVLNDYGRAVAARSNVSPEIASEWTVAMEIKRGHIPAETLILSEKPLSGLRTYGEHIVYNYTDKAGRAYYVKGYAVPLALIVPIESAESRSGSDRLNTQLMARLGMSENKINNSNPRVILACLPSLTRLRGELATRWFAPSGCPYRHR